MKYYNLETIFTFGKFNGLSLSQVLSIQPTYVNWCLEKLDHFYMAEEDQLIINSICPEFTITEQKMYIEINDHDDFDCEHNNEQDSCEDFTDWSNYNDDLDMDQQSIEFWNQF
jgi:hypothetical protein